MRAFPATRRRGACGFRLQVRCGSCNARGEQAGLRLHRSNTCAKRSQRGVALGRKSWLFTGSERGSHRAAALQTLIGRVKLNGIYPQA
tara:strand:+ start:2824 stop:3087 length:264 start_codon:yes stop_codon:yes gene_type:complete